MEDASEEVIITDFKWAGKFGCLIVCCLFIIILPANFIFASIDDFDLSNSRLDISLLFSGGPGKDGIPAILKPKFILGSKDAFLQDGDLVIGIFEGKEAKAYPIKILNWHEIVNDEIGGIPIAVSWCPLTKSGIVFDRRIKGEVLTFGVSGLLYNSNLVMYDKNYSGVWPQLSLEAATGKFSGAKVNMLVSLLIPWKEWKSRYPYTMVLLADTGFIRDYERDPYTDYHRSTNVMFPLTNTDNRLPLKSKVIGIRLNGVSKAYPLEILNESRPILEDSLGGLRIKIHKGPENTAYITDLDGHLLSSLIMYWFAWSAFNKDTLLFPFIAGGKK